MAISRTEVKEGSSACGVRVMTGFAQAGPRVFKLWAAQKEIR
jgi:hypothetical protein